MAYSNALMREVKTLLKRFPEVLIVTKNDKGDPFPITDKEELNSKGNSYRVLTKYTQDDFYNTREKIINFANEYNEYPDEYEGKRDNGIFNSGNEKFEIIMNNNGDLIRRERALVTIGMGSAFNPRLGNNSFLLDDLATPVLFDCGSTVFKTLLESDLILSGLGVAITHLHTDHIGSLGTLLEYSFFNNRVTTPLYVPRGIAKDLITILNLTGVPAAAYYVIPMDENTPLKLSEKLSIAPFRVHHLPKELGFKCYGFQIFYKDKAIIYSGDWKYIPKWLQREINDLVYDELYLDVSMKETNPVHLTLSEMANKLSPEALKNVILMHSDE